MCSDHGLLSLADLDSCERITYRPPHPVIYHTIRGFPDLTATKARLNSSLARLICAAMVAVVGCASLSD